MSAKMLLRGAIAGTLNAAGLLPRLSAQRTRAVVAMYHRVLPRSDEAFRKSEPGMVVSLEAFRIHLREYAARFEVVPLRELAARLSRPLDAPKPLLVITFDDGWRDNYDFAAPELQRAGLPATLFATVGYIQSSSQGKPFVTPNQLQELSRSGWEIGAHTWSHPDLVGVRGADLAHEVQDARKWIEDTVGERVVSFAYPRGKYDDAAVDAVRTGYSCAVTVHRGYCRPGADLALLPRVGIHNDMTYSLPRLRWVLSGLP